MTDGIYEEWQPRPFSVLMEGDDGERIRVRVAAAIGPRDAESQARDLQPYYTPLKAEEIKVPEIVEKATADFIDKYRDALRELA